ncbi:MAG TPA: hypothetical protein VFH06_04945 [Candidatus Saccharimonadales bacterium]|nr:hypothetical protein [Candidatus Saccharimonadales bacterium]
MRTILLFLRQYWLKLAGGLAVLALTAATAYYVVQAFGPSPVPRAIQAQQVSTGASPEGYMTLRETLPAQVIIDPQTCAASIAGVTATKKGVICFVSIDLHTYPLVRGSVGFCQDLDTTSPENSAQKFVLAFKGKESLILGLYTKAPEVLPGLADDTPPVSVSGIDDSYGGVDCTSLPADPN